MFESAEIGHRIAKKEYREREPVLRAALLNAQYALLEQAKAPVIILINGADGAGKGETGNLFNEWMDPRHIHTEAFDAVDPDHAGRPEMWRYWQALPQKGHIGILFGSWYSDPILAHVMGHEKKARFTQRLERIRHFERMLSAEGAVLLKFWFHLSRSAARTRFKALEKDPKNAWRVTKDDWVRLQHYEEFVTVCSQALRKTSTAEAPWRVIEGADPAYRALTAGDQLLEALQTAVQANADARARPTVQRAAAAPVPSSASGLLASFDYSRKLSRKHYEAELAQLQSRLAVLSRDARMASHALVLVFEGMDAAGKGSTLRRITQALDARHYRVVPIAAPTDEERAQPYLWRFWRQLPGHGHTTVFDRSWYGRVLVERVEGFCSEADWMRGYDEINTFEEEQVRAGTILLKFWMAITADEQLRRFNERKATPYKQFKITDDDWRNREKWPAYEHAVADMIDRTSTDVTPWHVVASDDKLFSRIAVLRQVCESVEQALTVRKKKGRA